MAFTDDTKCYNLFDFKNSYYVVITKECKNKFYYKKGNITGAYYFKGE